MFGNAGAKPPTDAWDLSVGSVGAGGSVGAAGENNVCSANCETVGHWLDQLPERPWDEGPDE